ncbi:MAG: efflux RND transporter periplasmic adaptor subunit [Fibrobacteria bacterium]|nr:efflux RND transporter periplasmic adaptor subunit [Fibrobacteria bacterium]
MNFENNDQNSHPGIVDKAYPTGASPFLDRENSENFRNDESGSENSFYPHDTKQQNQNPLSAIFGRFMKRIWKLALSWLLVLSALFVVFIMVDFEYKVSGHVKIMPMKTWKVYAHADGIIAKVPFNPGKVVMKGDTLFSFKRDELLREHKKQENNLAILSGKYGKNPNKMQRLKIDKEKLVLSDIEADLRATVVCAPISGRLRKGNTRVLAGKKVRRGDELAEVVALTRLKLKILVPEDDINLVKTGQTLAFRLRAMPEQLYYGIIKQISYETVIINGDTFYEVFAAIQKNAIGLRAGLTGRGKITTDKRSVLSRLIEKPKRFFLLYFKL